MTTITLNGTRPASAPAAWTGLVASFSDFCAGVREGRDIETRYHELSRMSRHDLAEIGLSRADIYRAALLGRPV